MSNPLVVGTAEALDSLDADQFAAFQSLVRTWAEVNLGEAIDAGSLIDMAKGIKVVAAADGFSALEADALREMLAGQGVPEPIIEHIAHFDTHGSSVAHVAEVAPPGTRRARYVLMGALTVACADGLSGAEHHHALRLGKQMGIEDALVRIMIAAARIRAANEGPKGLETRQYLRDLHKAMFTIGDAAP